MTDDDHQHGDVFYGLGPGAWSRALIVDGEMKEEVDWLIADYEAQGYPVPAYGTEGGPQTAKPCRVCWLPRYVWLGNVWGLKHINTPECPNGRSHECHRDEVWLA